MSLHHMATSSPTGRGVRGLTRSASCPCRMDSLRLGPLRLTTAPRDNSSPASRDRGLNEGLPVRPALAASTAQPSAQQHAVKRSHNAVESELDLPPHSISQWRACHSTQCTIDAAHHAVWAGCGRARARPSALGAEPRAPPRGRRQLGRICKSRPPTTPDVALHSSMPLSCSSPLERTRLLRKTNVDHRAAFFLVSGALCLKRPCHEPYRKPAAAGLLLLQHPHCWGACAPCGDTGEVLKICSLSVSASVVGCFKCARV